MNKKESYRERRKAACQRLFSGFVPDASRAKEPELVREIARLAGDGLYTKEIAERVGKSPKAVQKIYRRYDFPDLYNFCPPQLEERPDWKHGTKMMKGYLYRRVMDHPHGTKHGNYVAEHRLVMEKKLGRYLSTTEVVDHIDGDITNNTPENLRVFASNAEHLAQTLKDKCPNWSEDGRKKMRVAADKKKKESWTRNRVPIRFANHY